MFDSGWDLKWYEDRVKGREDTFRYIAKICGESGCKTVLDVGGGIGIFRRFLPIDIRHDVVDLSPNAKFCGESLFPDVGFTTGTIDSISDKYDAVVGIQLVEHMEDYAAFFKAAWNRVRKVVIVTFRNGLDKEERINLHKGCKDYWDNKYSFPKLKSWINDELNPPRTEFMGIQVDRDYSPELIIALYKEGI